MVAEDPEVARLGDRVLRRFRNLGLGLVPGTTDSLRAPSSAGAATRAHVPALLKGLIFGPNGRAMSPSHTRRRGRLYRYYVTREAIADGYDSCSVTSVPAADVEGAVLDHIQKLLAAPALVART
jgi:site-specific DNA recombinase